MCRNCFIQLDGDERLRVSKQIKQKVMLLPFLTDVSGAEEQGSKGSKRKLSCCTSELPERLRTTGMSKFIMCLITRTFQLLKTSLMSSKMILLLLSFFLNLYLQSTMQLKQVIVVP